MLEEHYTVVGLYHARLASIISRVEMLKAGINFTDVIDTQTDVTKTVTKFNFNQFYETTVALRVFPTHMLVLKLKQIQNYKYEYSRNGLTKWGINVSDKRHCTESAHFKIR